MKVLLTLLLLCGVALAQETGGHMGGGDWGGGGGGSIGGGGGSIGGGSSPSWSNNTGWSAPSIPTYTPPSYTPPTYTPPSRDYSSTGTSNGSGRPYVPDYDDIKMPTHEKSLFEYLVPLFIAGVFIFILGSWVKEFFNIGGFKVPVVTSALNSTEADVSVLRVAIDGRARRFIQRELKQIAQTTNTSTRDGRATMLRDVTTLLRRVRDAWVYGGAHNEPMGPMMNMKATFDRHVDDARTRFTVETISNVQGRTQQQDAGALSRRSDEGEGLILVTIVVAARCELFTVQKIADGEDLRKALEGAAYLGPDLLVAVDVIWMPSEDNDRMSSMELEARYPHPMLIPIQGALVGKMFCGHCSGPFPAELASCPHCGAPSKAAA